MIALLWFCRVGGKQTCAGICWSQVAQFEQSLMFGSRPFREPRHVMIGALVFAVLFEFVSVLVDFVATGRFGITWNSLWFFCSAFFGYILVAMLIRRADARAAPNAKRE